MTEPPKEAVRFEPAKPGFFSRYWAWICLLLAAAVVTLVVLLTSCAVNMGSGSAVSAPTTNKVVGAGYTR